MIAAAPAMPRLALFPAVLGETEVAGVLTNLERARASLRVAERDAARHGSAANNLTGLACLLAIVLADLDQALETVERASLRA
jgi:hypothetical protein